MWLTVPVMQRDEEGNWQNTGQNRKGTPQGGVINLPASASRALSSARWVAGNLLLRKALTDPFGRKLPRINHNSFKPPSSTAERKEEF
jgi:hypothetical protein